MEQRERERRGRGRGAAMERSTMEVISERLSGVEDLYFPRSTFSSGEAPSDSSVRKTALLDLLSRDAPLFLGKKLLR